MPDFRTPLRALAALAAAAALAPLAAQPRAAERAAQRAPRATADAAAPLPLKHAPRPTTAAITAQDLMTRLYVFADDSMEGRDTGTPGNLRALAYIERQLKALGLEPAGDDGSYYQKVPLVRRTYAPTATLGAGPATLRFGEDWLPVQLPPGAPDVDGAAVVFAGKDGAGLTAQQTAGRIVLLSERPAGGALSNPALGAAASIFIIGLEGLGSQIRGYLAQPQMGPPPDSTAPAPRLPSAVFISAAAGRALLGGVAPDSAAVGAAGVTVRGSIKPTVTPVDARNVVAIARGSDPALRGTYVAIGAHTDHVGLAPRAVDHDSLKAWNDAMWAAREKGAKPMSAAIRDGIRVNVDSLRRLRPARADSIHNGADDDGSGSMAVLEIAEAIARAKVKPKRSVLFVWHAGEERGLLGALHYTDHPTVPRDSIVAQLNIDMLGRGGAADQPQGGPGYVGLVGSRRLSTELGDLVEAVNAARRTPLTLDYALDANGHPENIYCRSDHYAYARHGIPVTFFFTGLHGDYHQLTDEPQYIDYPHYATLTQYIHDITLRVANLDHRPVVDKPKPDPRGRCQQ